MSDCQSFASHIPTPSLDPLYVGEVMGTDAFLEGDWVLLRLWENRPTKVTHVHQSSICVALEGGEDFVDTLIHFYPDELGYPLDHRLWSEHQKQYYLLCHTDLKLRNRWVANSSAAVGQNRTEKLWVLGFFLSLIPLLSKLFSYISRCYSISMLVWIIY